MSIIIDGHLHIFNRFVIDEDLPKYAKFKSENDREPDSKFSAEDSDEMPSTIRRRIRSSITQSSRSFFDPLDPDNNGIMIEQNLSTWQKIVNFFTSSSRKKKELTLSEIKLIFHKILNNLKTTEDLVKSNKGFLDKEHFTQKIIEYSEALKAIKENGQIALYDQMVLKLQTFMYENLLKSCGFNQKINEKDLISFMRDGENRNINGFRMDWVKNYTRLIPKVVADKKKLVDELKIFDNYVVLHYDPDGTGSALTKKEVEEIKKDPILFGVFQSSDNLYFIGDWVDEVCDLQFEEIVVHFAKNVGKLYIDLDTYHILLGDVVNEIEKKVANSDIQEIIKVWL